MDLDDPELMSDFLVEAEEHLDEIDNILLELEADPENPQWVTKLTGRFHTIKGMAGYVDFRELQKLCHLMESALADLHNLDSDSHQQRTDLAFEAVTSMRERFNQVAKCIASGRPLAPNSALDLVIRALEDLPASTL